MADIILFRALRPAWSHAPLSGEGAAINGGRWNRKGRVAIYFACDYQTALEEYWQGIERRPATIVEYHVAGASIAKIDDPALCEACAIPRDIMDFDWRTKSRHWRMLEGPDQMPMPRSWAISECILKQGYHGIEYPSRITGDPCVCIWRWGEGSSCKITVRNSFSDLPHDRQSWT